MKHFFSQSSFPLRPLCVDLDGTLIKEHSLWQTKGLFHIEGWKRGITTGSWSQFKWTMGSYGLKRAPCFHSGVLAKILRHREQGGLCFLVTGAPWVLAEKIDEDLSRKWGKVPFAKEATHDFFSWMEHCHNIAKFPLWIPSDVEQKDGFFHGIFASSPWVNLVGKKKAECLEKVLKVFDYIGNSSQDLWVWQKAQKNYIVGPESVALTKKALQRNIHLTTL